MADKYTAKYNREMKYDRPRLAVPGAHQMPKVQKDVAVGIVPGYTVMDRQVALLPGTTSKFQANRLPNETYWERYYPRINLPGHSIRDIDEVTREDFLRQRHLKDINSEKTPRIPNIMAYHDCTCKVPYFDAFGCHRDPLIYTQHVTYENMRKFPLPKDVGYYGYRHEQLDRHNTGEFWNSKRHV